MPRAAAGKARGEDNERGEVAERNHRRGFTGSPLFGAGGNEFTLVNLTPGLPAMNLTPGLPAMNLTPGLPAMTQTTMASAPAPARSGTVRMPLLRNRRQPLS